MDNKFKIIAYLGKNMGNAYTMHELSKAINIPYATFHRTIKAMKDFIIVKKVGKSKTIMLNTENKVITSYLSVSSEEEKNEYLRKQPILAKITSETKTEDIMLLFGSYAKNHQKETSDIDILIINKKGDKTVSFSKYEILFKKHINPIFITKNEFKNMLKEKEENIGKQALKNHIILNNPEEFWRLAYG